MLKKIPTKLEVTVDNNQTRLDVFLAEKLDISRSQVQKMIEEDRILINKKLPKKAGDRIKEGDEIIICNERKTSKQTIPQASRNVGVENFQPLDQASLKKKTIKIISATPDYLVVNKPAGLLTHPTMANEPTTLAFFLLKKYPEIKNVGEDLLRPGIVHRLDKEASGLLVVARTQKMFEHLKEQFKTRTIEKEYLILVHGRVAKDEGEINFPITRSETSDRMAARPLSNDGGTISRSPLQPGEKEARTEFLVEQRFVNFTLLRVKIHTGRTHQIRVHFLAYNHPVVGDQLYIQKKRKRTWDENLGRLFLHCTKLVFKDLENKACTFESSLPTELSDFLKLLS